MGALTVAERRQLFEEQMNANLRRVCKQIDVLAAKVVSQTLQNYYQVSKYMLQVSEDKEKYGDGGMDQLSDYYGISTRKLNEQVAVVRAIAQDELTKIASATNKLGQKFSVTNLEKLATIRLKRDRAAVVSEWVDRCYSVREMEVRIQATNTAPAESVPEATGALVSQLVLLRRLAERAEKLDGILADLLDDGSLEITNEALLLKLRTWMGILASRSVVFLERLPASGEAIPDAPEGQPKISQSPSVAESPALVSESASDGLDEDDVDEGEDETVDLDSVFGHSSADSGANGKRGSKNPRAASLSKSKRGAKSKTKGPGKRVRRGTPRI